MRAKNSKKTLKDPFRPKRPSSSFINFYLNSRTDILRTHRHLNLVKHASMVKIASQWWQNQNLLVKEKKKAKLKASQDLEQYRNIMKRYRPPSQKELKRRLKEMPKRFRTNWNFYVQDKFAGAFKKFRDFGRVTSYLATKWRELSDVAKNKYDVKYQIDRLRYEEEMEVFKAKYALEPID